MLILNKIQHHGDMLAPLHMFENPAYDLELALIQASKYEMSETSSYYICVSISVFTELQI